MNTEYDTRYLAAIHRLAQRIRRLNHNRHPYDIVRMTFYRDVHERLWNMYLYAFVRGWEPRWTRLPRYLRERYDLDKIVVQQYCLLNRLLAYPLSEPWMNFIQNGEPLSLTWSDEDRNTLSLLWRIFPSLHTQCIQYVDYLRFSTHPNELTHTSVLVSYKNSIEYLDHSFVRAIDFPVFYHPEKYKESDLFSYLDHYSVLRKREFFKNFIDRIPPHWKSSAIASYFRETTLCILQEQKSPARNAGKYKDIISYVIHHIGHDAEMMSLLVNSRVFYYLYPTAYQRIQEASPLLLACCTSFDTLMNYLEKGIEPPVCSHEQTEETFILLD